MKNILNNIWNWLLNQIIGEDIYTNEYLNNKKLSEEDSNIFKEYDDEFEDWIKLEEIKRKAIEECDGCKDEVFVLRKNGEDIAYGSNINKIARITNIRRTSLYRAYNKQNGIYKEYEITKLI